MKIYTKTGDAGTTALVGGSRVAKSAARLEAYGTVDELNSHIGLLSALIHEPTPRLQSIQNTLFDLGGWLATPPDSRWFVDTPAGLAERVAELEADIDRMDAELPQLHSFILPGGCVAAAQAHVARTVCRRAERRVVALSDEGAPVAPDVLRYLNRLSDYLFTFSRLLNLQNGQKETEWSRN